MNFKKNSFYFLITVSLLLTSCVFETATCIESIDYISEDYSNMALIELEHNWGGFRTDYSGIDLDSKKEVRFRSNSTIYRMVAPFVEIGDTLKKDRGSTNIFLIKKDSVFLFNFFCDNGFTHKMKTSFGRPMSKNDTLLLEKINNQ